RADDGVHRTGLDAAGAADADVLVDPDHLWRLFAAAVRSEGLDRPPEQGRQRFNAGLAAGRAAVDVCLAAGDGLGVWPAALIAAFGALGLRQQGVDGVGGNGHGVVLRRPRAPATRAPAAILALPPAHPRPV